MSHIWVGFYFVLRYLVVLLVDVMTIKLYIWVSIKPRQLNHKQISHLPIQLSNSKFEDIGNKFFSRIFIRSFFFLHYFELHLILIKCAKCEHKFDYFDELWKKHDSLCARPSVMTYRVFWRFVNDRSK
jgi:hypothetical protein